MHFGPVWQPLQYSACTFEYGTSVWLPRPVFIYHPGFNSIWSIVSIRRGLATIAGQPPCHWQWRTPDEPTRGEKGRRRRKGEHVIKTILRKVGLKKKLAWAPRCCRCRFCKSSIVCDGRQTGRFSDRVLLLLFCSSASEDLGCRRGDFSRKHYGSVELVSPIHS